MPRDATHERLHPARVAGWARIALAVLAVVVLARGWMLVRHDPLLAYANNYDQLRYTACLDLAFWRAGSGADVAAHPEGPLSRVTFGLLPSDVCVLTSDLLVTAPVAAAWHIAEWFGSRPVHSVERLAELRFLLWLGIAFAATRVFVREGRADIAIANLAWLAVVGVDPANTLYFATFYAEAAAVFGMYVCCVASAMGLLRPTLVRLLTAGIGAFVLGGSKFQHILAPLILALAILIGAGRAGRRVAGALVLGGVLGLALHAGNSLRGTWMSQNIAMINRADFLLTVLLPESSDPEHVARVLKLSDSCVANAGKNVYEIQAPTEQVCDTVHEWRTGTLWWLFASDPPAVWRALDHIPRNLLPWTLENLGVVEGEDHAGLPAETPSISRLLGRDGNIARGILLLPWIVVVLCFVRRSDPIARAMSLAAALGASSVAVVSLLGDGDVEYNKHAHLAIDFALGSVAVLIAASLRRFDRTLA